MSRGGDGLRVVCSRVFGIVFFKLSRLSRAHRFQCVEGGTVRWARISSQYLAIGSILLRVLARGTLGLLS